MNYCCGSKTSRCVNLLRKHCRKLSYLYVSACVRPGRILAVLDAFEMNSALKPVLPQPGVPQPGGQASPAKGNVANANHAVGHPQGAQNSLHHASNNLVGQNLTHHAPAPQVPANAHAAPPMAPVSANMAQMAQNMSHHGNLSHVTTNSVGPSNLAASPSKGGNANTPLSLVQEKALALTRTPEKNEPDSTGHANGTIDSPKSASNAPSALKPQNPESNKDKQDIAKTSPSTPKPPEKPLSAPNTPQKPEPAIPASAADGPAQPKVATANEPPEKSPSKPTELKPAPAAADVPPTQSDSKPVPESAKDSQLQENAPTPVKQDPAPVESAKIESAEVEAKKEKEEPKVEKKPQQNEEKEEKKEEVKVPEKSESPKKEEEPPADKPEKVEKVEEKVEEKKSEVKPAKVESKPKPTLKLATVTTPMRKRRQASPSKSTDGVSPAKKLTEGDSTPDARTKRNRTKVQLYQSPTPELAMATKLSASAGRSTPTKPNDDKLIVFYKNEYLAVRNAEGGFYVCQAMQNVYRTTRKIKIRWLSQDKAADPSGETYKPDFYDTTDMECVLTTLSLSRGAGGAQLLRAAEAARARSILTRALQAEVTGEPAHALTEEHPDGLDLSLYKDESQLEKKSRKRNSSKSSPRAKQDDSNDIEESATPVKRARTTPKRSPKSARKTKTQTPTKQQNNKRKSAGTTPIVASTSKTATALSEKSKAKSTPKRTPAKQKETPTPIRKGRRAVKETKASPIVPTPSTSTGKTTRTPRKPPAKK